jgi:4-hydroxyphenylpyruvate dioxygenase-like putative hemolysin
MHCNDIYATYEELKAKGVEFMKPPTKEFYATEALFKDDSGNYFSLQPKEEQ